jgi:hypothetical protein
LYSGKSVKKWYIDFNEVSYTTSFFKKSKSFVEEFKNERLISTKIYPYPRCVVKPKNVIFGAGIIKLVFDENRTNKEYLCLILNSRLIEYYCKKYLMNFSELTMNLNTGILSRVPIKIPQNQQPFINLCNYMLFLNTTEEQRKLKKELIYFINKQIIDSLIYELYFKEKFHEDGLYPEPKEYLLELVSKHLKPINYDRWAELYWKKQLDGNLTSQEEKELENLEKENLKTIEEVYNSLVNDKQIQKQIEKIKSHEWVKVIEGER